MGMTRYRVAVGPSPDIESVLTIESIAAGVRKELPSSGRIHRAFASDRPCSSAKFLPPFYSAARSEVIRRKGKKRTNVVHRVEILFVIHVVQSA